MAPNSGPTSAASAARNISMGWRQLVESANSALKGAFADLSRGFFRIMGLVKMTVLLGFTLAAYNVDRVRSFKAKQGWETTARRSKSPSGSALGVAQGRG